MHVYIETRLVGRTEKMKITKYFHLVHKYIPKIRLHWERITAKSQKQAPEVLKTSIILHINY